MIVAQQNLKKISLWDLLNYRPWKGQRSKKNIDKQIKKERDSWHNRARTQK